MWEYQSTHQGLLPDDQTAVQELEAIANKLISDADVNKQVLPAIPRELVEYVHDTTLSALPVLTTRIFVFIFICAH